MAITHRASSTGDLHLPGATTTITKPTGTVGTDVLTVKFGSGRSGTVNGNVVTAPAGWAAIVAGFTVTGGGNCISLYGFVGLGGNANLGFGNSQTSLLDQGWVCDAWVGVDNTTPIDATGTTSSATGVASLVANVVPIATIGALHLIGAADWNSGTLSSAGFAVTENAHTNESAGLLYSNTAAVATGNTGTVTISDSASATSQIIAAMPYALRPAAGGPTETYPAGHGAAWRNPLLKQRAWAPRGRRWDALGGDVRGEAAPTILSRRARRDRRNLLESAQRERRRLCPTV